MKLVLVAFAGLLSASPLVRSVTVGRARVDLEDTTFTEVASLLGEAPIVRVGDAGGSRAQACYRFGRSTPTTFYLESSEMGGDQRITQVDVVGPGAATAAEEPIIAARCARIAVLTAGTTDRGVKLGLTRRDVERLLRAAGRDSAGITLYAKSERSRRGARALDVSSWLRVRYRGGRVAAFSTGVVTTD